MPEGTAPWITATFDDSFGGANTVRLTMSANNLVDSESIASWFFNFDPLLDPTDLIITAVSIGAIGTTVVDTGANLFMADGDGFFDIMFDFPPPPGNEPARFTAGETVVYDFTYIAPLTVDDFDFGSELGGGSGVFNSAAQIQGIGPQDNDSGWIGTPVPEPGTGALLSLGLVILSARRRRSSRR